ncbi:MAG: DUF4783 domain-containing protein [Bacteroidales bacterium]|nr:DUF4783 domain-containing protein [Bacteroidales bacterium]
MKLKYKFVIVSFVMAFIAILGFAQERSGWKYQLPKECWDAMLGGKTQDVAKYFASSVELSLPSGSGIYSSKQATVVLEEFLSKGTFKNADVDNERQTGNTTMMIATAEIAGRTYRLYILTQQEADKSQIIKLRIEEEK